MKKLFSTILSTVLLLSLAACGGGKEAKAFSPDDAQSLLNSGAFSETLTEIDQTTACRLYGIDETTVTGCAVYGSTGTTAEELAIFTFENEEDTSAAAAALGYRVEDRKDELANYLPDEISKLDEAVVETRGNSALLVIAADYSPVDTYLKG